MDSLPHDILALCSSLDGVAQQMLLMREALLKAYVRAEEAERERDALKAELARLSAGGAGVRSSESVLDKLLPFFTNEELARRFLDVVRAEHSDTEVARHVNHYWETGAIRRGTKKTHLWRVLYNAQLYRAQVSNWNSMVNFKGKK